MDPANLTNNIVTDQNPKSGSDKIFALVGKIIIAIFLTGGIAYGGFYLGTHYGKIPPPPQNVSPTITPLMPTITTTPTTMTSKKVSAGTKTQFFTPYTIEIPSGWTDTHTSNTASNDLIITKGAYTLTISQAAGGGGSCIFAGEPEPMAQVFPDFVGITGISGEFRRGTNDGANYTVCEKKPSGYGFPTSFGYITYSTPKGTNQALLTEMDGMVATLSK